VSRPTRAEAPSVPLTIRVSPIERERLEQAARVNRQSLSQFSRDVLLDEAEECLEKRQS
jgi:uncharacterized protein (DUF1778 family)